MGKINTIIDEATDKELDAMERYSAEVVENLQANRHGVKAELHCSTTGKHKWVRKRVNSKKLLRFCSYNCGTTIVRHFDNETLRYMAKNPQDFAIPGTKLWAKFFGTKTEEQVRKLLTQ